MRILTCSNSCPQWDDAGLSPRSPGGLVPMLIDLLDRHGGQWLFTAPPGVDPAPRVLGEVTLHPIDLDEQLRRKHYDTVSIGLFLGLLHYLHDTSVHPVFDAAMLDAWAGYESVNRTYAQRLDELARSSPEDAVLINDPHLMLVPEYFVTAGRTNPVTYFLGTPWCEPDYFSVLPARLRTRVLESLLRCDVVGFHSRRWVDAFLACCRRFLPDARIDGIVVRHRGAVTTLVVAPFPLDTAVLDRMRREPATARWDAHLTDLAQGRRMLLRADRLDLWKNLPRGFLAFEAMLERDPTIADECWFVSVVTKPSRPSARHRAHQDATEAVVARINRRFARPGRDVVTLIRPGADGDSRHCVVAALGRCAAVLVNSTYDGMNLFAKEAAHLMPDDAVLLLSANAGAYEQLAPFATTVDPFDVDQTSRAIESALRGATDPDGHLRAAGRRAVLDAESAERWLSEVFLVPRPEFAIST